MAVSTFSIIMAVAVAYHFIMGKKAYPAFPTLSRRLNMRTLTGKAHPGMTPLQRLYRVYVDVRYIFFQWFHTLALHLDDILFPGYRDVEIKDAVFMVGGFRTGSTSLHRLMAMDDKRYITPKAVEVGLPYMWLHYLFDFMEFADERWNLGIIAKIDKSWIKWMTKDVVERHPMAWHSSEEDDMLLGVYHWCGYYAYGLCPDPEKMLENGQISKFPQDEQHRIFDFYKKTVQKIMYRRGAGRTFLSKSHLIELMPTFKERFPGSKFVGIMRDPKDTFVSWFSLCRAMTRAMNKGYAVPEKIDLEAHFKFHKLFGDAEELFFLIDRKESEKKRIHNFVFKDFIKNQEEVLFSLYKEWGQEVTPVFREALEDFRSEHQNYKDNHNYKNPTLAELGLDESYVKKQFEHYNRVFGIN
jgi:hypothetical protein